MGLEFQLFAKRIKIPMLLLCESEIQFNSYIKCKSKI